MAKRMNLMRLFNLFLAILILVMPIIISFYMPVLAFDSNPSDYRIVWTDEVQYWLEVNTYKAVGFNGGYFSIEEKISGADFTHFGTHGPIYPMFIGTMARVFPWSQSSGPIYNLAFIAFGLLIFLITARPDYKQKILILLFVSFLYPTLLYIPTNMQEGLHQGFACIVSGLLIRQAADAKSTKLTYTGGGLILIITFAALIRVTWAIVLFPAVFLIQKNYNRKTILFSLITAAIMVIALLLLYSYWTSPFPDSFISSLVSGSSISPKEVVYKIIIHSIENIRNFFTSSETTHVIEILQRYEILYLIIIMIILLIKKYYVFALPLFILVSEVIITIAFYDVYSFRDFRTLAPFLIIAMLFFTMFIEIGTVKWSAVFFIIVNILFFPFFLETYRNIHTDRFAQEQNISFIDKPIAVLAEINFEQNSSPWCNSLLTTKVFTPDLLSLKPGIGINVIKDISRIDTPVKSNYLLVPPDQVDELVGNGGVVKIDDVGEETLYQQTNNGCPRLKFSN